LGRSHPHSSREGLGARACASSAATHGRTADGNVKGLFFDDRGCKRRLRASHDASESNGVSVLEVSVDGRDYDASFDGDQVDADQRDAYPSVNDNALVENSIEHVN
jgi:hypothetical protein